MKYGDDQYQSLTLLTISQGKNRHYFKNFFSQSNVVVSGDYFSQATSLCEIV